MNLSLLYVRVSTKEQAEQGYSLEAQEKECRKFAFNNGFEVDKVFVERGESAKTQNRTELHKLVKYALDNKKKVACIIVWKFDRLTRNLYDLMELVKSFSSVGITILSATENNEDSAAGRLTRNMIGVIAQYENDVKSERTKEGMKEAIRQGRWCWRAPVGYKNARDDRNKRIIIPSDKSRFIVEAFELAESGLYKQTEILAKLKRKGFKELTKNRLNRILRSPLYAGLIKVPWLPDYINAIHKPIISKDTFFKVQLFLNGKRHTITPRVRNHPDFPLRNFIRCPKCGQKLTGGWSTNRKKVRYAYYHCRTKRCSLCVRKEDLETKFYEFLRSFQPNEETLALFEEVILDVWKTKQEERIKEQSRLEKELKEFEERRDRIEELIINKTFDEETYKRQSDELKNEILVKRIELNEEKIELNDIEACINYCKFFMANIADLWANADLTLKQRFQILIFPEKIYYDGESFKTARTALIFKELQAKNLAESSLASPTRFELVSPP